MKIYSSTHSIHLHEYRRIMHLNFVLNWMWDEQKMNRIHSVQLQGTTPYIRIISSKLAWYTHPALFKMNRQNDVDAWRVAAMCCLEVCCVEMLSSINFLWCAEYFVKTCILTATTSQWWIWEFSSLMCMLIFNSTNATTMKKKLWMLHCWLLYVCVCVCFRRNYNLTWDTLIFISSPVCIMCKSPCEIHFSVPFLLSLVSLIFFFFFIFKSKPSKIRCKTQFGFLISTFISVILYLWNGE